jgi:hypothetical protein
MRQQQARSPALRAVGIRGQGPAPAAWTRKPPARGLSAFSPAVRATRTSAVFWEGDPNENQVWPQEILEKSIFILACYTPPGV